MSLKPLARAVFRMLLLNAVIFLFAIALHECGHLAVGTALGCEGKIVLPDMSRAVPGPYTEIRCPADMPVALALSGFALLVPFGLFLLVILRRAREKSLALVVFGLALVLSGADLTLLTRDAVLLWAVMIAGAALICAGEFFLINEYVGRARRNHANSALVAGARGMRAAGRSGRSAG